MMLCGNGLWLKETWLDDVVDDDDDDDDDDDVECVQHCKVPYLLK